MENQDPHESKPAGTESTPEKMMDELKTLLDDLKVKAHLGKMEARDAWKKVEPEIRHSINQIKAAVRDFVQNVKSRDKDDGTQKP